MTVGRIAPFTFDRSWDFPVSPERVLADGQRRRMSFPLWWGWLRAFESEGLATDSETDFVVQGALPYKLHFVVLIERLIEERLVDTVVSGDLEGPATLEISAIGRWLHRAPALEARAPRASLAPTVSDQSSAVVVVS